MLKRTLGAHVRVHANSNWALNMVFSRSLNSL
jgi:hypothetical protein